MNVTNPRTDLIAATYRVSRQRVFQIRRNHGLTIQDFREPDLVFSALLDDGRANSLRRRLSDAATRETIRQALTA